MKEENNNYSREFKDNITGFENQIQLETLSQKRMEAFDQIEQIK